VLLFRQGSDRCGLHILGGFINHGPHLQRVPNDELRVSQAVAENNELVVHLISITGHASFREDRVMCPPLRCRVLWWSPCNAAPQCWPRWRIDSTCKHCLISLAPGIIYERFSRWQPQYVKTRVGEGAGPGAALARVKLDHKSGLKFTLPYLPAPFIVSIILRRRNKPSTGLSACLAIHSIFTLTAPSRQKMSSISSS
jgi:hypothetical protein